MEYRKETESSVTWCQGKILSLNVSKTKIVVIDFRKWSEVYSPVHINDALVEIAKGIWFLDVNLTTNLSWSNHIDSGQESTSPLIPQKMPSVIFCPFNGLAIYCPFKALVMAAVI